MKLKLKEYISDLSGVKISADRKDILQKLVRYIQEKRDADQEIYLNFICTHNSRRSHMAQVWAQTMAQSHGIDKVTCYSGGTEATAVYPVVIRTLKETGFEIEQKTEDSNPVYNLAINEDCKLKLFSKTYDHKENPSSDFAAIMTCSDADQNCPIIFGAERIPVTYEDPKAFDDSPLQIEKYRERSTQIATEMAYVFSNIKK